MIISSMQAESCMIAENLIHNIFAYNNSFLKWYVKYGKYGVH
jgi:hypothetical protein